MPQAAALLIDVSNTFTKLSIGSLKGVGAVRRLPTRHLTAATLCQAMKGWKFQQAIVGSVVPSRNATIAQALSVPILWVDANIELPIGIDYPRPQSIGADRLANAVACAHLYGVPSIVVDFGTAVTFDVLSQEGNYVGGVIAPGMGVLTEYLHERTALLPQVKLRKPQSVLGKSTEEAIRSGAIIGYRGLIREILQQIRQELFPQGRPPTVVATGGDALWMENHLQIFDAIAPKLTLEGLRLIAIQHFGP